MAENEMDGLGVHGGEEPRSSLEEETSIDLVDLLRKLLHNWKAIAIGTLAVAAVVTSVAFLLPFRYTSTTSFVPPGSLGAGGSMASAIAGQLSSLGGGDLLGGAKAPGDLYAGILRSHSIAGELVKRFNLMNAYGVKKESRAEAILAANTTVSVDAKSSIVAIEVTAKDPQLAQNLARAYMEALRETNGRLALDQSSQRAQFFGQQLASEKDRLADAEVDLKRTEEQSGMIAPSGQTAVEIGTLAQTQAQIAVREVQLAALRDSATDQNPEVIRLRSEIGDLQGQLARLQQGSGKTSSASIPTSKVPELQLEFVRKEREVKYHEALFDMLSRQYEAARLDQARDAPVLQVLDEASYPDTKSSPKRSYFLLGGLIGGFFLSCVWVLTRDSLARFRAFLASGVEA